MICHLLPRNCVKESLYGIEQKCCFDNSVESGNRFVDIIVTAVTNGN